MRTHQTRRLAARRQSPAGCKPDHERDPALLMQTAAFAPGWKQALLREALVKPQALCQPIQSDVCRSNLNRRPHCPPMDARGGRPGDCHPGRR